jgi:hypothetical protein
VGRDLGIGVALGVKLGVGVGLGDDVGVAVAIAVAVGVTDGVGLGVVPSPQYLAPVSKKSKLPVVPPQAIISLPVHTAVWENRAAGALVVLVAVQLSVPGLYLPPVLKRLEVVLPPHTII